MQADIKIIINRLVGIETMKEIFEKPELYPGGWFIIPLHLLSISFVVILVLVIIFYIFLFLFKNLYWFFKYILRKMDSN